MTNSQIKKVFILLKVTTTYNIVNYTALYSKSQIERIFFDLYRVWIQCQWTDFRRSQPIWLRQTGYLALNNTHVTIRGHQIIMIEIHLAITLSSGNPRINFIYYWGMVTCVPSNHFQACPRSITLPDSTWHQAYNTAPVKPKDFQVIGHYGKHMISPMVVMVDLKCSPLSNSQDMGHHLQMHLKCSQHCLEIIQSFGQHLLPLLHQDNFPARLGDPTYSSQRNDFSRLLIRTGQMLQELAISPQYQWCPTTNAMQMMRAMIRQTWAELKAKPQSAWSKRNSRWSNLSKGWGSPTLEPSTPGRTNGCLGLWRRSIGPVARDRPSGKNLRDGPLF